MMWGTNILQLSCVIIWAEYQKVLLPVCVSAWFVFLFPANTANLIENTPKLLYNFQVTKKRFLYPTSVVGVCERREI